MKKTSLSVASVIAAAAMTFGAHAKTKPSPDPIMEPTLMNAVSSYILLDRTGSMSDIWDEALGSVNAYAEAVGKVEEGEADDLETSVTLAVFDHQEGFQFDVLRKDVQPDAWSNVTNDEVSPRGMTPLFDAINRTITMAEADNPEKAVIVIMTDGHENSSREVTRAGAKAALDRAEARGWEVVFLGAEFASFGDADAVGVSASKQMAVSAGSLAVTQERLARKAREYGKGEEDEIVFDAEDRTIAEEEDVKERKGPNR
ncbi:MAG: vWA domain-containing protein [Pseudomonadota bacterium]